MKETRGFRRRFAASFARVAGWAAVSLLIIQAPGEPTARAAEDASKEATRRASIAWRPVENAVKYQFELAATPEMDPVIHKKDYTTTSTQLLLKPGTYYFRIRGVDEGDSPGPWSDVQGFVVNPHPPVLTGPGDGEQIVDKIPKEGLKFAWKAGIKGSKYVIEIRDQKGIVLKRNVNGTDFTWMPPDAKKYAWRVGFETVIGEEWSKYRVVTIDPKAMPQAVTVAPVATAVVAPTPKDVVPNLEEAQKAVFQAEVKEPRNDEWSLLGRAAQAVAAYSGYDEDLKRTSAGSGVVGFVSAELRWRGGKSAEQRWTWSGSLNFEMIRQNVLNTLFQMPRFYGRVFYGKEQGQWRAGPFIQLYSGQSGIFIITGNTSARSGKVSRKSVGAGASVVYRPTPSLGLSALAVLRMDTGGDAGVTPTALDPSMGYEAGFGSVFSLNSKIYLEGRLRALQEELKWKPANGGASASHYGTLFIILDVGVGFKL